jgi:hypothetical protein
MPDDNRLNILFSEYRRVTEAPDASAEFMPRLWERIEARRRFGFTVGRLARGFVTAAAVLSMGLLYLSIPPAHGTLPNELYVEILAEGHTAEDLDYFEPANLDPSDPVAVDRL